MGLLGSLSKTFIKVGTAVALSRFGSTSARDLRPLAKSVVKGGLVLYACAESVIQEVREQVKERRAETSADHHGRRAREESDATTDAKK